MVLWVIIASSIAALLIIFLSVYVVCRFSAREEVDDPWVLLSKSLVVFTISLACFCVLIIPLEIALKEENPGLPFLWVWRSIFIISDTILLILCPFAFIFYESWTPYQQNVWQQVRPALMAVFVVDILFFLIFVALWSWGALLDPVNGTLTHVSPLTYTFVSTTSIGWCCFAFFAGVGLASVPIHGFYCFLQRPRAITEAEYQLQKTELRIEVQRLIDAGRRLEANISSRPSRTEYQQMALFKREVRHIERLSDRNEVSFRLSGAQVLRSYIGVFISCINCMVSILWITDIILANVLGRYTPVDHLLCFLHGILPMVATMAYAYLTFYLMWCTVAGCWSLSNSILIFPVFPIKAGATMLNALLFNSMLVLCSSFAIQHLSILSGENYARQTEVRGFFVDTMGQMRGVRHVSVYAQHVLLFTFALSIPWLVFCPNFVLRLGEEEETDVRLVQ